MNEKIKPLKDMLHRAKTKKGFMKLILFLVFVTGLIVSFVYADKIFGSNSVFNDSPTDNEFLNAAYQKIPALIRSVQIVAICYTIHLFLSVLIAFSMARTTRGITISKMISSFLKYLLAIVVILGILGAWGVDTNALIASAGVLGLVIGLGAQSLISDVIAGAFIVFEREFEIGDIIVVDDWRGTVTEIGIRTTKIIDAGGNVKIVNNSTITTIVNQSKALSLAKCFIQISYDTKLKDVEKAFTDHARELSSSITGIVGDIRYLGVNELGPSGMTLFFVADCNEESIFQAQRDLNRSLRLLFDENGFKVPYQRIMVEKED